MIDLGPVRRWAASLAAAIVLLAPRLALAQAESEEKSYVGPYFLVGMSIALGVLIVCKSARRRDEVKPVEEPVGPQ